MMHEYVHPIFAASISELNHPDTCRNVSYLVPPGLSHKKNSPSSAPVAAFVKLTPNSQLLHHTKAVDHLIVSKFEIIGRRMNDYCSVLSRTVSIPSASLCDRQVRFSFHEATLEVKVHPSTFSRINRNLSHVRLRLNELNSKNGRIEEV